MINNFKVSRIIEYVPYNPVFCKMSRGTLLKYNPKCLNDIDKKDVYILLRQFRRLLINNEKGIPFVLDYIKSNFCVEDSFVKTSTIEYKGNTIEVINEELCYKFVIHRDFSVEQYPEEYLVCSSYLLHNRIDWLRENMFDYKNLIDYNFAFSLDFKENLL